MSDRFQIYKTDDDALPWNLDYPNGFSERHTVGEQCHTFSDAVAAFVKRQDEQCPTCLRGAVVDRPWGWECTNCGSHDVAVGCIR